jgi:hypothetical protein
LVGDEPDLVNRVDGSDRNRNNGVSGEVRLMCGA